MKKTSNRLLNVLFTVIFSTMVFGFIIAAIAAEPIEQQGLVDKDIRDCSERIRG